MDWTKPLDAFAAALLLGVTNMAIVNYLAEPVRKRYPELDLWWLLYVALGTGSVIGWFANVNLFAEIIPTMEPLAGKILTCVLIGGGSKLLHDVFDRDRGDVTTYNIYPKRE